MTPMLCRSNLAALDLQSEGGVPGLGSVSDFLSYSLANHTLSGLVSATNAYRKLDRQMATYVANNWLQVNVPQPSASIIPFQECPSLAATVRPLTSSTGSPSTLSSGSSPKTGSATVTRPATTVVKAFGSVLG